MPKTSRRLLGLDGLAFIFLLLHDQNTHTGPNMIGWASRTLGAMNLSFIKSFNTQRLTAWA